MNSNIEQIFLIYLLLPVAIITIFFFFLKAIRKKKKKVRKEHSEMSFVVETFHDLVARLKEKEREMEVLRKKAEERADDVESYSENIIQSVPSGVVSLDNDLSVTKVNSAASKILRCKPEDMVGKSYREVFRSPIREIIESRKKLERVEHLYESSSGEKRWIGLTTSSLLNRDGNTIGQILVFTDLTELKSLENQIRLREWLSSLGEISLGIAHELRNPMAVIAGYATLLSKKIDIRSTPEVEAIMKEINVMDRIIGDFLSFAKPITPNVVDMDIKDLIENIVGHLLKDRRDIKLDILLKNHPIKCDEVLLRQAFSNLIQNAIEAMPDGGILRIISKDEGDSLSINISDTGKGIPGEIKEKIFLPFYTTKERGTGLGLSIVHKNITLLGGSLHFVSSDEGTVFSIRLPLK